MPSHPNQELAHELWQAVSSADVEAIVRLSTEDLTWHSSGTDPRPQTVRGRDEVLAHLARIGEVAERWDSELEDVLVGDLFTALLYRVVGVRGERKLETGYLLLLRIEAGRLAEAWSIARDQHAVDAFWQD